MPIVPQIDLPDEIRAQIPGHDTLGTLKIIKVLTCKEFAELKPNQHKPKYHILWKENGYDLVLGAEPQVKRKWEIEREKRKVDYRQGKVKRRTCSFRIWNREHFCLIRSGVMVSPLICKDCNEYEEKSKWPIHYHISPVDTDIAIPTPHRPHREYVQRDKVNEDDFT